jgi:hypothetical protein
MNAIDNDVFGTGFMLAILVAAFAVFSPIAAGDDELMPAVDTSSIASGTDQPVGGTDRPDETRDPASGNDDQAMDSMELGRTEITGNQELPKVMYIVPWRKSDPGDLMGRPVNTLLDEVLAPIDREEFVRQVDYYEDLASRAE